MPSPAPKHPFGWNGSVAFGREGGGFAYVPNRALARLPPKFKLSTVVGHGDDIARTDGPVAGFSALTGSFDVVRVVAHLRSLGIQAQPDHVFFAHGDCCCSNHPADLLANPVRANPVRANPVRANPVRANPVRANPVRANPVRANPVRANDLGAKSSVRPTGRSEFLATGASSIGPLVTILDTGLAGKGAPGVTHLPKLLAAKLSTKPASIRGVLDVPDFQGDGWLDVVAGHGTFIAGLIELHAPGCVLEVRRVIQPEGQGDESMIASTIAGLAARKPSLRPAFLNLSFGGDIWDNAPVLLEAVLAAQAAGIVVVASAGNDGTCRPTYPAAFPGVVSVGGIGPDGPSWFSNYGDWVRACAPAQDIESAFFTQWDGRNPAIDGADRDEFTGTAVWSGTSFATPLVIAALVREVRRSGCSGAEAVRQVIDAPHLGRLPGLGTVVNL